MSPRVRDVIRHSRPPERSGVVFVIANRRHPSAKLAKDRWSWLLRLRTERHGCTDPCQEEGVDGLDGPAYRSYMHIG